MADPNRPEDIASAAVKFDGDKTMYDLIPWDAIEELGKLYTKGAKKYAARNWEKGFRYGRTFAAMSRHAIAWFMAYVRGESGVDPETGLSHMVAVAWNALALVTFELRKIGIDDRPGAPDKTANATVPFTPIVIPAFPNTNGNGLRWTTVPVPASFPAGFSGNTGATATAAPTVEPNCNTGAGGTPCL